MIRLLSPMAMLAALLCAATPTFAQSSMSQSDIDRLRVALDDAVTDIDQLRSRDAQLASTLSRELNDLRDEVAYLRVKLRKENQVSRSEYVDLRDRIDDLRVRARDAKPASSRRSTSSNDGMIPAGTELDVRLQDRLSSARNEVEDRFLATTVVDLQMGENVVIPAGSELRGVVSSVEKAGRLDRKGNMTLSFDEITIDGEAHPMRGVVTKALEGEVSGEAVKLGTAAGVGAIIGGILGGGKGALAGVLIGGGGMAAATPGSDVELEPGTILRIRLDQPPDLR
jgi:hypothetical protein